MSKSHWKQVELPNILPIYIDSLLGGNALAAGDVTYHYWFHANFNHISPDSENLLVGIDRKK